MKEFINQLLTNRLGIVLAALNLCYFVSPLFARSVFSQKTDYIYYLDKLLYPANLRAISLSMLSADLLNFIFSESGGLIVGVGGFVLFVFFITLQWLLVGWTAKTAARAVRSKIA